MSNGGNGWDKYDYFNPSIP